MNNKGFTMIELLASMVLLSVLMLTAVPTVLRVMDESRKTTVTNDAKKFVSNVEYKIKHNNNYIKRPKKQNDCILLTLGYLDLSSEFKEGPHGGAYSLDDSFVVVKLKSLNTTDAAGTSNVQMYDYYVTLIEIYDKTSNYGIYLVPFDKLSNGQAKQYVSGISETKFFSKNSSKLLRNTPTALGSSKPLGCNNDLVNSDNRADDKVYDTNDSLREQGIGE